MCRPQFPRPAYQDSAVGKFLNKLAPGTYKGLFNPNGRVSPPRPLRASVPCARTPLTLLIFSHNQGIPDVSAQADNFRIFLGGRSGLIGGTSAAAPTFASFVSLLNSARLSAHLPPLGFLNPLVYAIHDVAPDAFNDITTGNNPGCGTPGFNATQGWDAVTGVGTPNFGKLKDVLTFDLGSLLGLANSTTS